MFSELTWLCAVLLGLGVLVVGGPVLWMIRRAVRDRAFVRDPHGWRRRRAERRRRRRSRRRPF